MTNLTAFLPLVLPRAPGCLEMYALLQLRLAAIDFCERTRCWRETLSLAVSATNTTLTDPTDATIHKYGDVWFNDTKLTPVVFEDVNPIELTGAIQTSSPRLFTQPSPGVVSIYPFQTGTLRLSVFLKPRQGQSVGGNALDPLADAYDVVPAFMFQHWAEAIAAGALARILSTPNETFTDPQSAANYAMLFEAKASNAASGYLTGQQRAPLRTKPNWF